MSSVKMEVVMVFGEGENLYMGRMGGRVLGCAEMGFCSFFSFHTYGPNGASALFSLSH